MSERKVRISIGPVHTLVGVLTAMVGYTIHSSLGWALVDFFFWPVAICYWLVTHQLTLTVVKNTFAFLGR